MRKSKSNTKIAKQSFGIIWYMNKQKLRINNKKYYQKLKFALVYL